jgi:DNA-binding response OmpR family regulator
VTKSQIFSSVYGLFDQDINESVIESHVCKLRRRLRSRLGYDPIESRRHLGYRLVRHPGGRCDHAGSHGALSVGRREDMS